SVWLCKGYDEDGRARRRWHITSDDISPESFPELRTVVGRGFAHAVSFHGFTRDEILVGGAAPCRLREEIAAAIRCAIADPAIVARVAQHVDVFAGDKLANIVNRVTANRRNGVQIEQSLPARQQHALAIADAVADVYCARLSPCNAHCGRAIRAFGLGLWAA